MPFKWPDMLPWHYYGYMGRHFLCSIMLFSCIVLWAWTVELAADRKRADYDEDDDYDDDDYDESESAVGLPPTGVLLCIVAFVQATVDLCGATLLCHCTRHIPFVRTAQKPMHFINIVLGLLHATAAGALGFVFGESVYDALSAGATGATERRYESASFAVDAARTALCFAQLLLALSSADNSAQLTKTKRQHFMYRRAKAGADGDGGSDEAERRRRDKERADRAKQQEAARQQQQQQADVDQPGATELLDVATDIDKAAGTIYDPGNVKGLGSIAPRAPPAAVAAGAGDKAERRSRRLNAPSSSGTQTHTPSPTRTGSQEAGKGGATATGTDSPSPDATGTGSKESKSREGAQPHAAVEPSSGATAVTVPGESRDKPAGDGK